MSTTPQMFSLAFDRPRHGWIPVRISIEDAIVVFKASNVLNDPVAELAAAGRWLMHSDEPSFQVDWWLEPDSHSLVFEPFYNRELLSISLHAHHQGKIASARSVHFTKAPTLAVCREIASSLRGMVHRVGRSEYESIDAWNRRFPDETIGDIYSELRSNG